MEPKIKKLIVEKVHALLELKDIGIEVSKLVDWNLLKNYESLQKNFEIRVRFNVLTDEYPKTDNIEGFLSSKTEYNK